MTRIFTRILFIAVAALAGQASFAQNAAQYGFTVLTGTYTNITGGTAVTTIQQDDNYTTGIPIGFTFQFCGVNYTTVSVSSNGWMSFNGSPGGNYLTNDLPTVSSIGPALMPLWDDDNGVVGSAFYQTSGVAPNRVFTFEWRNWEWNYFSSGAALSFQVKLFETTNVIQFIYRQETAPANLPSATIGIAKTTSDYQTLPTTSANPFPSSNTFVTTLTTKPATDQIYQWTPPPPCSGAPTAGAAIMINGCPTAVSLSGYTIATNMTFQWQSRPSCGGGAWANIPGANQYYYNLGSITQPMEFRAYVICNNGNLSDTSTSVTVSSVTPCYCVSGATSTADEEITNVTIGTMNNSSVCGSVAGPGSIPSQYSNYSTIIPPIVLSKGTSVPFSLSVGTCGTFPYTSGIAMWIDFNGNGTYESTERVYASAGTTALPYTVSGTFNVPSNAATGITGLRVVNVESTTGTSIPACGTFGWGETEDYLVNIAYVPTVTGDGTYCSGDTITLVASAPGLSNPHFLWAGPDGFSDTSASFTINNAQFFNSGNYTVYVLSYPCGGTGTPDTSASTTVNVLVNQTPNAPVVSPVIVYCQNDVFDSIAVYGQNIQWYSVPTGGVAGPAPVINTAVPNTATYYISQIVNGCEGPRAQVSITVAPKPAPPAVVSPVGYCQGNDADPLIATGQNVRWYTVATGGVGTTVTPTPTTNAQGSYTWYATQTIDGCESDRVPVVVNIGYVPNAVITTSREFVCQYDTMTVGYFGNANDTATYTWTMPAGATILQGSGQGPLLVKFDSAGIRTVTLIVNNGGCVGPEATKDIPVHLSPRLAIDAQPDACVDEIVSLAVTYSTMGIDQYLWNFDGADTTYASLPRGPFGLKWATPGSKVISVTAIDDGCVSLPVTDIVNVHALPDATITASSTDVCSGDSILFSAVYDPAASYQWLPYQFFPETNSSSVWGTVSTNTKVILNVTNNYNCRASDSIMVAAKPCCQVYFPTAFTPNNDGKNDLFRMLTIGKSKDSRTGAHEISVFKIQNRWGQTVYESADETRGWDGTFNGQPQDMGVYYFYVKYKCSDGNYYEEKGELTLVR